MVQFQKQLITPTVAKQYLEANISNRRVKIPVVMQYANDMLNGRWKEDTAETIKISKTGIVLDGQHRLMAIVKSGVSVFFTVAINLDDSVFDVIDTGSSRNASDTFKVKGIKQESSIPSTISFYNLLSKNMKQGARKNNKSTNAMLLEQYYEDEMFWQNVARQSHAWYLSFAKIIAPSFIGGFYAFFLKLNEDKAHEFMTQLTTGIDIKNNTISLLRNKLMQDKMSLRKMPITLKTAFMIKTWNVFIKNETHKILRYDALNEPFPVAISGNNLKYTPQPSLSL
jgi:hypothetical protein